MPTSTLAPYGEEVSTGPRAPTVGVTPTIPTPPSLAQIGAIGSAITGQNIANTQAAQAGQVPGATGLAGQESTLVGQELAGEVPADVMNLLREQGAEGTVGTGGNSQAAYLRALGLTSIGQEQSGIAGLSSELASHPAAPIFNASSEILTPAQQAQIALSQAGLNLQAQEANQRAFLNGGTRAGGGGGGGGGGSQTVPPPAPPPGATYPVGFAAGTDIGGGDSIPPGVPLSIEPPAGSVDLTGIPQPQSYWEYVFGTQPYNTTPTATQTQQEDLGIG